MTQLRSLTCHMGSHSVTCHPTQANTPRLNPSQTGWYSIYLPRRDGRLSWPIEGGWKFSRGFNSLNPPPTNRTPGWLADILWSCRRLRRVNISRNVRRQQRPECTSTMRLMHYERDLEICVAQWPETISRREKYWRRELPIGHPWRQVSVSAQLQFLVNRAEISWRSQNSSVVFIVMSIGAIVT